MNDLDYYYTSLYDEADIYVLIRRIILTILLITLGVSIYVEGKLLYFTTVLIAFFQIIIWILKIKIDNIYQLAHDFQRCEMLKNISRLDVSEIVDLKQKVSLYVSGRVKKKKENNASPAHDLKNSSESESEIKILKDKIHENSYFNYYLYKYTFQTNLAITVCFLIMAIIPFSFFIPYIKTDPELLFPRLLFTILSFGLIYEFIESTLKYKKTSETMRNIDNYLVSKNKENLNSITKIFSQYNEAKLTTPNIPACVYNKYKDRLNEGWNLRQNEKNIRTTQKDL